MTRDLGPDLVLANAAGIITMQGRPELETGLTALAVRDGNIIAVSSASKSSPWPGRLR